MPKITGQMTVKRQAMIELKDGTLVPHDDLVEVDLTVHGTIEKDPTDNTNIIEVGHVVVDALRMPEGYATEDFAIGEELELTREEDAEMAAYALLEAYLAATDHEFLG